MVEIEKDRRNDTKSRTRSFQGTDGILKRWCLRIVGYQGNLPFSLADQLLYGWQIMFFAD
jgi:hypothetical protein